MKKETRLLDFFAEAGLLKRVKRSGWWVLGIREPESVAEHCFRCAVIGYALAHMEKASVPAVTLMCLFNDFHEARINDFHKMAARYINYREAEDKAYKEQTESLPPALKKELRGLRRDYCAQAAKESVIARDADILECLLQAKEYLEQGRAQAKLFFQKAPGFLKTKSAQKLWKAMKKWDSSAWWRNVAEFRR